MGQDHVECRTFVRAPIAEVFDRITDHEAMAEWPGISSCELIAEGSPRNGVGAVRRIKAGGVTLDEEVVRFDPPHRYDYTIIKGLPVKHLGTVTLSEVDGGVEVRWTVDLSSRVPLLAEGVGCVLGRGLPGALRAFAAKTAERCASDVHPVHFARS
ncbi:MAG: SRPBCC family protein [Polyangiaceae bacterium]|jgi:uncharacterized protein YndB with AHSA1/START domain